jgi:hypothetical protein
MGDTQRTKIKVENSGIAGMIWIGGWLFTLGFLKLAFWKGVLALIVWPYYLGSHFGIPCEQIIK